MDHALLIAILAGLGGMIGWGFADFFAKKTIDRIGDIPSLVWAHVFGTSIFILIAAFSFAITGHAMHLPGEPNRDHSVAPWADRRPDGCGRRGAPADWVRLGPAKLRRADTVACRSFSFDCAIGI